MLLLTFLIKLIIFDEVRPFHKHRGNKEKSK